MGFRLGNVRICGNFCGVLGWCGRESMVLVGREEEPFDFYLRGSGGL